MILCHINRLGFLATLHRVTLFSETVLFARTPQIFTKLGVGLHNFTQIISAHQHVYEVGCG